jgi:DNA polymerase
MRIDRAKMFLAVTHDGEYPLPIPLKYCGAHTQRWSGDEKLNPQNLPSGRDGRGARLREAIQAPPGYVLVAPDSGQIEARVNAWLWGQEDLLQAYREGRDPYSELAAELYGIPVIKGGLNSHLRPVGKAMILGLGFGMGWERFLDGCLTGSIIGETVEMDEEGAKRAVEFWRTRNYRIVDGWYQLRDALTKMLGNDDEFRIGPMLFEPKHKRILMPNDLYLHYRGLHTRRSEKKFKDEDGKDRIVVGYDLFFQSGYDFKTGEKHWTRIWHSKLDENIVQCLARIIVGQQALEIAKRYKVVLLVHDEVVFLAKEEEAEEALAFGLHAMTVPPSWCVDIPLASEGKISRWYTK